MAPPVESGGSLMTRSMFLWAATLLVASGTAFAQSPYAGQESREVKALSPQEVADLLAGRGMGLAKAAELNGYPGPLHVLELAAQLQLTPDQKARTEALFNRMQARAVTIGRQIVDEERALDRQFAAKSITPASLQSALTRIADLQAELRRVHLETHLEQTALLSEAQTTTYTRLRGYAGGGDHSGHGRGHR